MLYVYVYPCGGHKHLLFKFPKPQKKTFFPQSPVQLTNVPKLSKPQTTRTFERFLVDAELSKSLNKENHP